MNRRGTDCMRRSPYHFEPAEHLPQLTAVIRELEALEDVAPRDLDRIQRRHPKRDGRVFSKSEIIRGYRYLQRQRGLDPDAGRLVERLQMKPVRTHSGVAPVTVLTKPYPCPGRCIFCPNDVRMPKSYLSNEPGAQRAASHGFDPYLQTYFRLRSLRNMGHRVDKVELIVLGGTWSFYPEPYQIWFLKRCFDALNDFADRDGPRDDPDALAPDDAVPFDQLDEIGVAAHADRLERSYNQVVSEHLQQHLDGRLLPDDEHADWSDLESVQRVNEGQKVRCVGLVLETRPDHISEDEVIRVRRLGATKVQIGIQSLNDVVLAANRRGHDVAATRRAFRLLRAMGFKLHAHWMPNLYGSNPQADLDDFERLFGDPDFCPDELKLYPCSLIESAELMVQYRAGAWRPYSDDELLGVVTGCLERTPPWCRLTRVIRDIPSQDIVVGNKQTNFREVAERALAERGGGSRDIRSREIRRRQVKDDELHLDAIEYTSAVGREVFLQFITDADEIAGFLRLSLPSEPVFLDEIADSAMVREVHVYGALAGFQSAGETSPSHPKTQDPRTQHPEIQHPKTQHRGLGRRLLDEAARRAVEAGFHDLAVISSVGTRDYYRRQGFTDGELYQHLSLVH